MTWRNIPGETPDQDIEFMLQFVHILSDDAVIVELGALVGRTTVALAEACHGTNRRIYTVDNFRPDHTKRGGWITPSRADLIANLAAAEVDTLVEVIKGDSAETGRDWEGPPVDFLIIDADHSYEAVKADLTAWLPNIGKNGIIGLHDFANSYTPGVERAAREILGNPDCIHWLTAAYFL